GRLAGQNACMRGRSDLADLSAPPAGPRCLCPLPVPLPVLDLQRLVQLDWRGTLGPSAARAAWSPRPPDQTRTSTRPRPPPNRDQGSGSRVGGSLRRLLEEALPGPDERERDRFVGDFDLAVPLAHNRKGRASKITFAGEVLSEVGAATVLARKGGGCDRL